MTLDWCVHTCDFPSIHVVRAHSHPSHYHHFPHEKEEVCDLVQNDDSGHVPHEEEEGVLGRPAKVLPVNGSHDVSIPKKRKSFILECILEQFKNSYKTPWKTSSFPKK